MRRLGLLFTCSILILCSALPLLAVQSLYSTRAAPDTLYTTQATSVKFTVQVAVDPNLISTGVTLVQVNAQGQQIATLGRLYDDGTHGDAVLGDGIYTNQFTFNQSAVGTLGFIATAAYKGTLLRARSPVFNISVLRMPAPAEVQATTQTQQSATQVFQTLLTQNGPAAARTGTVSYLRGQPNVSSAGISSDGTTVFVQYTSGINGTILGNVPGTQGGGYGEQPQKPLPNPLPVPAGGGQFHLATSSAQETTNATGNCRAVVMAPFFGDFSAHGGDASDAVASLLSNPCSGSVQALKDSAVTVNLLKTLNQYGVIYLNTHGAVDGNGQVFLVTGEDYTSSSFNSYPDDFTNHRLIPTAVHLGDGTFKQYISILPAFVQYYYGSSRFPNSVVFASACSTLGADGSNLTMSNAFTLNNAMQPSAGAYLGWAGTVSTAFNAGVGPQFFSLFANVAVDPQNRTTGLAYSNIPNKTDSSQSAGGTVLLKSSQTVTLKNNLVVNGGFETGNFSGWTVGFTPGGPFPQYAGPAGPYVEMVTTDTPIFNGLPPTAPFEGTYQARLGRWDSPYQGHGQLNGPAQLGMEPAETDWIYQDVQLPATGTVTLTFAYNINTFDAAPWDWLDVQIIDSLTGSTLANVLADINPSPGPTYGTYNSTGWQTVTFDLSPWLGKLIRLRFSESQDGWGDQTASYVDNIQVTVH